MVRKGNKEIVMGCDFVKMAKLYSLDSCFFLSFSSFLAFE